MKFPNHVVALALALPLVGCFTLHETPYPETVMSAAAPETRVALEDFRLVYSTIDTVHTTETRIVNDYGRHGHYRGSRFATVDSNTYIPGTRVTDAFRSRAENLLERAGFIMRATAQEYVVSGEFSGPYDPAGADWRRAAVLLGSGFFAEYDAAGYRLTVRVHEIATGKALLSRDYLQEYSASGFSPLWIIGLCCFGKTDADAMRSWCCNALVDRAMADVSSLLSATVAAKRKAETKKEN